MTEPDQSCAASIADTSDMKRWGQQKRDNSINDGGSSQYRLRQAFTILAGCRSLEKRGKIAQSRLQALELYDQILDLSGCFPALLDPMQSVQARMSCWDDGQYAGTERNWIHCGGRLVCLTTEKTESWRFST